jgi:hypothetical protein
MARNKPTGDNARVGAVKDRSQVLNPKTDQYVKRDTETGKFMDVRPPEENSRAFAKKSSTLETLTRLSGGGICLTSKF